jgi:hypothetical protein
MASKEYRHAASKRTPATRTPENQVRDPEFLSTVQVADLAQQLTGKRPSPSTITRWMLRGARGQRLTVRRIGGRLYTPRRAALEWLGGYGDLGPEDDARKAEAAVSSLLGRAWGSVPSAPKSSRRDGGAS